MTEPKLIRVSLPQSANGRSQGAWIVEGGSLDLFVIAIGETGQPQGAHHPVVRVEAGEIILPIPGDQIPYGLFAAPSDGAVYQYREFFVCDNTLRERWRNTLGVSSAAPMRELVDRVQRNADAARHAAANSLHSERLALQSAWRQLASPLSSKANFVVNEGGSDSALARLCAAMASATGIPLRFPGPSKDPDIVRAIARAAGVRYRRLALKGNWWNKESGPMFAFLEDGTTLVALLPRPSGGYDIFNPHDINPNAATRPLTRVTKASAQTLQGFSYMLYRPFPSVALNLAGLIRFSLRGAWRDLALITGMGLSVSVLGLAVPLAVGIIFDTVIPNADRGQLAQIVLVVALSGLVMALVALTRGLALLRLEGRMDFTLQAALWDRLLALPAPFFRQFTAGDLASRGLAIQQIRELLSTSVLSPLLDGISAASGFLLIFYLSPGLGWVALANVAAGVLVSLTAALLQVDFLGRMATLHGTTAGVLLSLLNGIAKLRVSATESRAFAQWAGLFASQQRLFAQLGKLDTAVAVFDTGLPLVATTLLFWSVAGRSGTLSTGAFLAVNNAFMLALCGVISVAKALLDAMRIIPLYSRLKPILETLPESRPELADPGKLTGAIEIANIEFGYGEGLPLVLRGLSVSIRAGECVAFVGETGCGKSTLLRLLLGFETPGAGSIYYDGQDLATLDPQRVRAQMGVVLQNSSLLPGDLLSNIVGSAPLTVDDAWEAARIVGLETDIKAMPMGMYTMVQEGGRGFSGGQRQRLLIARAVVERPAILLFDEATSALDNETQALVSSSLEKSPATRIIVAHRLSTIRHADRIFVIDQGRVAQSGTYQELMEREGVFSRLAARQLVRTQGASQ